MVLTENSGSTLMDGTEQTIIDVSTTNHFSAYIFLNPLASGDSLTIRIYVKDVTGATTRLYKSFTYANVQGELAVFLPFIPTSEYKVTLQQTAGTNRTFNWVRYTS